MPYSARLRRARINEACWRALRRRQLSSTKPVEAIWTRHRSCSHAACCRRLEQTTDGVSVRVLPRPGARNLEQSTRALYRFSAARIVSFGDVNLDDISSFDLSPSCHTLAMPPRAASSSPRKGTTTKLTSDPTPLALPALLKLLTTSGPKPPHLSMSQAIAAASKLVPGGYTSHAKLRLLNQADMIKLGIADDEIRKGLMAVIGKGGGKGSGESPEVRKKRTRESDLDRPLPTRAPKETVVDEDFDFEEIEAEEVHSLPLVQLQPLELTSATAGPRLQGVPREPGAGHDSLGVRRCGATRLPAARSAQHRCVQLFLKRR